MISFSKSGDTYTLGGGHQNARQHQGAEKQATAAQQEEDNQKASSPLQMGDAQAGPMLGLAKD